MKIRTGFLQSAIITQKRYYKNNGFPIISIKKCERCGDFFPCSSIPEFSSFYQIRAKNEKNPRWEDNCKECKKNTRKGREQLKQVVVLKSGPLEDIDGAKKSRELLEGSRFQARNQHVDMLMKEKLSLALGPNQICEKTIEEGILNFNKFVSVLLEEYGKQMGASVYVKGKRS